jgi:hypothetical protein
LEVQDLEDEVAGLETRLKKLQDELGEMEVQVSEKNNLIKDAKAQIKKYEGQQAKVRNNREYDSLDQGGGVPEPGDPTGREAHQGGKGPDRDQESGGGREQDTPRRAQEGSGREAQGT